MEASDRVIPYRHFGLIAALLVGCAYSVAAAAATGPDIGCDHATDSLQPVDYPVEGLADNFADSVPTGVDSQTAESLEGDAPHAITVAPVLDLTPRMLAILDEIFGGSGERDRAPLAQTEAENQRSRVTAAGEGAAAMGNDVADRSAPAIEINKSPNVARFQRQMYRKDI